MNESDFIKLVEAGDGIGILEELPNELANEMFTEQLLEYSPTHEKIWAEVLLDMALRNEEGNKIKHILLYVAGLAGKSDHAVHALERQLTYIEEGML